jgi:hypothetical protein
MIERRWLYAPMYKYIFFTLKYNLHKYSSSGPCRLWAQIDQVATWFCSPNNRSNGGCGCQQGVQASGANQFIKIYVYHIYIYNWGIIWYNWSIITGV